MFGFDEEDGQVSNSMQAMTLIDQAVEDTSPTMFNRLNISVRAGLYGMANNAIEIGNYIGVSNAEVYNIADELDQVGDNLGDFYRRSSGGYDLAGDVITSLVPGGAAMWGIKAAKLGRFGKRAARTVGYFDNRLASTADQITDRYRAVGRAADVRGLKTKAFGYATAQNAVEGAVVTAAVEASLNLGELLNDEGLTAMEKATNFGSNVLLWGAVPAPLISIGTYKRALIEPKNVLKGEVTTTELKYTYRSMSNRIGDRPDKRQAGDKLAHAMQEWNRVDGLAADTPLSQSAKAENLKLADLDANAALSDLFPITRRLGASQGKSVKSQVDPLRDWAKERFKTKEGREEVAQFFVGVERVAPISDDVFAANGEVAKAVQKVQPKYVDRPMMRSLGAADEDGYKLVKDAKGKRTLYIHQDHADDLRFGTNALVHYSTDVAEDVKGLVNDLDAIEVNMQVTPGGDTFKRLQNAYRLRTMDLARFKSLYPAAAQVFEEVGEELSAVIYGQITPRYLDTLTGQVLSTPVQQIGDLAKLSDNKDIGALNWRAGDDSVHSVTLRDLDSFEVGDDMFEYQARRVLAGRDYGKLAAKGREVTDIDSYSVADIHRLDEYLNKADRVFEKDGIKVVKMPGKDKEMPLADLIEKLAERKGQEFERIAKDAPEAAAQDIANTIGVGESFVLNRGAPEKLALQDLAVRPEDLMGRRTYVAQQRANMPDEATSDVMSYLESQYADNLATLQATANRLMNEDLSKVLPEIDLGYVESMGWNRFWQGSATIGDYGSLNSLTTYVGNWVTHRADTKFNTDIYPHLLETGKSLAANPAASSEYLSFYEWYIQQDSKFYKIADNLWVQSDIKDTVAQAMARGTPPDKVLRNYAEGTHYRYLENQETIDYVQGIQRLNQNNILGQKMAIEQAYGNVPATEYEALYLPPRNFKFVEYIDADAATPLDPHSRTVLRVVGNTQQELSDRMEAALTQAARDGRNWNRISNKQVRDYKIATLTYDWVGDELQQGYAKSEMRRSGALQSLIPETNVSQLIADNADWFKRQNLMVHRASVEMYYADVISSMNSLVRMEQNRASASLDTVPGVINAARSASRAKQAGDYEQVMHQMIGHDEKGFSVWQLVNNQLEDWTAKMLTPANRAIQSYRNSRGTYDWEGNAKRMKEDLAKNGINLPYESVLEDAISRNTDLVAGDVRNAVSTVNHILSTALLRLDSADGAVNVLGYLTKASSEFNYLRSVVKSADDQTKANFEKQFKRLFGAGSVPGKTGPMVLPSTAKTLNEGIKRLFTPEGKADVDRWTESGLFVPADKVLRDMFEELVIDPASFTKKGGTNKYTEKARAAGGKIFDTLSWASNKSNLVTQYSALHAAETLGQAAGLRGGNLEAFMFQVSRRVNAITNPVQKPRLFQGAGGIALSLYQSFMFHTLSNILRYLDAGNKSAVAMLAGMNSTFFGAQSLPGFNYMNTTLVGRGAEDGHTDLFGAAYTGLGKEAADFLMYGAASSLLQGSLYTRGNMTPRTPVLIPTSYDQLPIANALASTIGSVLDLASGVARGEPMLQSSMDALSNLGLNRPLTGLITIARGKSVDTNYANVMVHDDVYSIASGLRVLGIRPINEQIVRDYQYRLMTYRAQDAQQKIALGKQIRVMYDDNPNIFSDQPDFLLRMQRKYVKAGGNPARFDGFLQDTLVKSTDDLSLRLEDHVRSNADGLAQYRNIMGGY